MVTQELEQVLFEELGLAGKPGLQTGPNLEWPYGRAIPGINAALYLQNRPLAYFSRFSEINPEKIKELHLPISAYSNR